MAHEHRISTLGYVAIVVGDSHQLTGTPSVRRINSPRARRVLSPLSLLQAGGLINAVGDGLVLPFLVSDTRLATFSATLRSRSGPVRGWRPLLPVRLPLASAATRVLNRETPPVANRSRSARQGVASTARGHRAPGAERVLARERNWLIRRIETRIRSATSEKSRTSAELRQTRTHLRAGPKSHGPCLSAMTEIERRQLLGSVLSSRRRAGCSLPEPGRRGTGHNAGSAPAGEL